MMTELEHRQSSTSAAILEKLRFQWLKALLLLCKQTSKMQKKVENVALMEPQNVYAEHMSAEEAPNQRQEEKSMFILVGSRSTPKRK